MLFARVRAFFYPSNVDLSRVEGTKLLVICFNRVFFFFFFFLVTCKILVCFFLFDYRARLERARIVKRRSVEEFIESQTLKNIIRNNREIRRS